MKLKPAPVQHIAQQTLPYVADIHIDGAAIMLRGDTRERVAALQALLVAAMNALPNSCGNCGRNPGSPDGGCDWIECPGHSGIEHLAVA